MPVNIAVIIHLHTTTLNPYDTFNLKNNLDVLKDYPSIFVCPNEFEITKLSIKLPKKYHIEYFSNNYFKNAKGYNKLLLSKSFYSRFLNYDYILICQTDVLILKDELLAWCTQDFDYIGAPWISAKEKNNYAILGVGNGGLSLRRVAAHLDTLNAKNIYLNNQLLESLPVWFNIKTMLCLKVVAKLVAVFKWINAIKLFLWCFSRTDKFLNEDIFWCGYGQFFNPKYTVSSVEKALAFAFETEPEFCFKKNNHKLPFGVHKWYVYDKEFWIHHCEFIKKEFEHER